MSIFLGRKGELARLLRLRRLKRAAVVVIKGRRRVGKSTLVEEFAKNKRCISLSSLPPAPELTEQMQRGQPPT